MQQKENLYTSTNEPIYSIELIRLIGVILITFTHIRHNYNDGIEFYILEYIPKYGTLILSVISGFLYSEYTSKSKNLLNKKIKTLLLPYLLANLIVIIPVLLFHLLGYDFLNRLTYDWTMLTEGLFSLNSPPINPPTFFIRDIFIIFSVLSLVRKDLRALFFILPVLFFGNLLLNYDIVILFTAGYFIAKYKHWIKLNLFSLNILLLLLFVSSLYYNYSIDNDVNIFKFFLTIIIYINIININIKFVKTGGYTYFLHLFHSPIIVFSYYFLAKQSFSELSLVVIQILLPLIICFLVYKYILVKYNIKFITGGR